jgi:hypothetical protein
MSSKCPVCATENDTEAPRQYGEVEYYSCRRCGPFFLSFRSDDLSPLLTKEKEGARLPRELTNDIEKMAALSHWIRTWYESHQREPTLYWELVKSITGKQHPPPMEQAESLIRWIGDNSRAGESVHVDERTIEALVGSADPAEFGLIFDYLKDQGTITGERRHSSVGAAKTGKITFGLSFAGWERYQELKRATSDSRMAFMAMDYHNSELADIFKNVFHNAVEKAGFDLRRLVDTPQPAGLIDDDLRVKIRAARFLVADLTDRNPGAYWEAGYAEGLGKPVIYTCRKGVFEDSKSCPHFDTNHHLTILWDTGNPQEAGEKLKATIRATLPAEAKLADD